MRTDDERDVDALVRQVVLAAADPTRGQPIPEPTATPAELRAWSSTRRRRRRVWSLLW